MQSLAFCSPYIFEFIILSIYIISYYVIEVLSEEQLAFIDMMYLLDCH